MASPLAAPPTATGTPMLLAGEWVHRERGIEVRDPEDDSLVDVVPAASRSDMARAIGVAVEAAAVMRRLPTHRRMAILWAAADAVAADAEAFAVTIAREGIKTIREARKEVTRCVETLRLSAEEARRFGGETIPFDQRPGSEGRIGYWRRDPVGVIGAITPFNDPLNLVAHKVGPALAAGNAIVLKPHRATPLSALRLARAIVEAGLPAGALQVLTGTGEEIGDALVTDPRIRMLSFTGGRSTGEAILRRAGLKKTAMELGSNSPVIVAADADLDLAVSSTVSGAYWAAGQNCLHVQRVYVEAPVTDEFTERFVAAARALRLGPKLDEATDMGPLISVAAAERVAEMVADGVARGGRVATGGHHDGTRFEPTVVIDVADTAALARDEVYGPVTIISPVSDLDEALRRANAADFGLQAAIFTTDLRSAFRAVAELQCGGVMVNESTDYRIDAMPFGGVKGSGMGREGVRFTVEEMTEPKVVCLSF